jgi:NADPH:quinone reductase-like Zn-dependent oxidoreductase
MPRTLDPVVAAALPTAGGTALQIVDSVEPLTGKTVLLVGAAADVPALNARPKGEGKTVVTVSRLGQ